MQSTQNIRTMTILPASLVFLGSLLVAGLLHAQASVETQTLRMTTAHAERVSEVGTELVRQIGMARASIANGKLREAKGHTWTAMRMASQLHAASPSEDLRRRFATASAGLERSGKFDRAADVEYMEVDIALETVISDLRRAHQALAKPGNRADAAGADALLQNAEKQVQVIVVEATSDADDYDMSDA
jgi:hypothetical protein